MVQEWYYVLKKSLSACSILLRSSISGSRHHLMINRGVGLLHMMKISITSRIGGYNWLPRVSNYKIILTH